MSKIKVDTIQSNNENVELAPNGTGVVEVKGAGGEDGTVKLVSSNGTNAVKIKSPPHSAGQSSTLILPDNNITQNAFLKVKSVSGSASNTETQLEYASIAEPDLTNLNANNLTSGTVPAARFPTSLAGTSTALKLIQKAHVTTGTTGQATTVASITMSLDAGIYYVLGKHVSFAGNYGNPEMYFKNANGDNIYTSYLSLYGSAPSAITTSAYYCNLMTKSGSLTLISSQFDMYIFNRDNLTGYDQYAAMYLGTSSAHRQSRCEAYMQNANTNTGRAYSFEYKHSSQEIAEQTQILLYKISES